MSSLLFNKLFLSLDMRLPPELAFHIEETFLRITLNLGEEVD